MITVVQIIGLALELPLNLLFIYGGLGFEGMGGPGVVQWLPSSLIGHGY